MRKAVATFSGELRITEGIRSARIGRAIACGHSGYGSGSSAYRVLFISRKEGERGQASLRVAHALRIGVWRRPSAGSLGRDKL